MLKMIMSLAVLTALTVFFAASPLFAEDNVIRMTNDEFNKQIQNGDPFVVPEGKTLQVYDANMPQLDSSKINVFSQRPGPTIYVDTHPNIGTIDMIALPTEIPSIQHQENVSLSNDATEQLDGASRNVDRNEINKNISGQPPEAISPSVNATDAYDRIINLSGVQQGNHISEKNGVVEIVA